MKLFYRKNILIIMVVLLLGVILFAGCQNDNPPDNVEIPDGTSEPIDKDPSEQNTPDDDSNVEKPSPNEEKNIAFNESFPSVIYGNPKGFIKQIVPDFKIGLSQEEAEQAFGEPDLAKKHQFNWGATNEWVYNNVNDYQLSLTFDDFGNLFNFKLSKYLSSNGVIPKVINKTTPTKGDPIDYSELGFEEVLLGTPIKDVLNRFGEPMESYMSYDEFYGFNLGMVYQGITLHIKLENDKPYVQYIETNDLGTVETYRGIQVGSLVEDVIESYGNPPYDWKETGDLIYATDDYWFAIKFTVESDKVTSIDIYEAS